MPLNISKSNIKTFEILPLMSRLSIPNQAKILEWHQDTGTWFHNDLINNTENTINGIYNFLELPTYKHQYDNIENTLQEDIMAYGMPEMHDVRPTITRSNNNPEEVLSKKVGDTITRDNIKVCSCVRNHTLDW